MKIGFLASALLLCGLAQAEPVSVLPLPAQVDAGRGRFLVEPSFAIAVQGPKDEVLERGALRLLGDLSRKTGFPLGVALSTSVSAPLIIRIGSAGKAVQELGEPEGYDLDITPERARLSAPTTLGALRGMETFLQLVAVSPEGFAAPAVGIQDKPRFPWRGLLIDVGRHFMPVDVIKRELDAMAAAKLNVLHWHLSEYQGFRVESKRFPKLQELGSDGLYYTQDQVRDVIAYARDRGIRVVPEFDMPGHSQSWFAGYPDLAAGPGPYAVERRFGIFDPAMDPTRESTYKFLDKFIGEMAALFPDRFFHIGGDEVNGKQWDANPRVQEFMKKQGLKDNAALQHYFNLRVQALLAKHGKTMEGWDEILGPGLSADTVVQVWHGQDFLAGAVKLGYRGLLSFGYYLDAMSPAAEHYAVEPFDGAAAALTPEEKARVLGGEACLWTEGVTPDDVDSRLWPRTAAVAERLWSPREELRQDSLYDRLETFGERLELSGLRQRSGPVAMLRRMTGGEDRIPLSILAEAVVPVDEETREEAATAAGHEMTTATPLDAFTDAVPPESRSARIFSEEVDSFLAGDRVVVAEEGLRAHLAAWKVNDEWLEPMLARSFLLQGLPGLSRELSVLGETGLQALDYIDKHKPAPKKWVANQLAMLGKAAEPQADVRFAVIDALKKLVQAAGSLKEK